MAQRLIELRGDPLSAEQVEAVGRGMAHVTLADASIRRLDEAQALLRAAMRDGQPHYGINTGFGALGRIKIDDSSLAQLQLNLIRSHATAVGAPWTESRSAPPSCY